MSATRRQWRLSTEYPHHHSDLLSIRQDADELVDISEPPLEHKIPAHTPEERAFLASVLVIP
jgi:hypothetical protein